MPLSDHEQRLLDQIERALYDEDPKFASTVRSTDLRTHTRRRLRRAAVLFVLGFGLLLAGVFTRGGTLAISFGVSGFVVMLAGLFYALSALHRGGARVDSSRRARGAKRSRGSVMGRVEERWKRRWEDRGRG